jgi:hypothetical protein
MPAKARSPYPTEGAVPGSVARAPPNIASRCPGTPKRALGGGSQAAEPGAAVPTGGQRVMLLFQVKTPPDGGGSSLVAC